MGNSVVPHLTGQVEAVGNDVTDGNDDVRIDSALALASLAEASAPHGIESFESVFMPLLEGVIGSCRGKVLAAFLMEFVSLIPLMDAAYANHFAREGMGVLVRKFDSPDEQEKQIVLNMVKQCARVEGVKADYNGFLPEMFKKFLSLDTSS
ncbi:uncharacterized protein LOC130789379 [Actinidia eriantha]|uniref:uncharacterized protein LOC130789379 n=1 Tax=Actinidia eriantha TaxID=165200 RepID=UPI0025899198|nr:uncharacterized protein LOC130789379 [Actinidia eriantha]